MVNANPVEANHLLNPRFCLHNGFQTTTKQTYDSTVTVGFKLKKQTNLNVGSRPKKQTNCNLGSRP